MIQNKWRVIVTSCFPNPYKVIYGYGKPTDNKSDYFPDQMSAQQEADRRNEVDKHTIVVCSQFKDVGVLLYSEDIDQRLNWPLGKAEKLARQRWLPYVLLPDGSIRFRWEEIERLVLSVTSVAPAQELGDAKNSCE